MVAVGLRGLELLRKISLALYLSEGEHLRLRAPRHRAIPVAGQLTPYLGSEPTNLNQKDNQNSSGRLKEPVRKCSHHIDRHLSIISPPPIWVAGPLLNRKDVPLPPFEPLSKPDGLAQHRCRLGREFRYAPASLGIPLGGPHVVERPGFTNGDFGPPRILRVNLALDKHRSGRYHFSSTACHKLQFEASQARPGVWHCLPHLGDAPEIAVDPSLPEDTDRPGAQIYKRFAQGVVQRLPQRSVPMLAQQGQGVYC